MVMKTARFCTRHLKGCFPLLVTAYPGIEPVSATSQNNGFINISAGARQTKVEAVRPAEFYRMRMD